MIENHGYACETHYITTEDGYILAYHRIPRGINDDENTKKPAVLLMHGLTSSSAEFVSMGPDRGFAYILADEGYDVWLANARGNGFSRNHTTLDPDVDADKFYDFTWHEIGYYDIASAIDYILDVNGDSSLYYIGHSQGATVFLVLASTRPDYNDKIRLASLMAPAAILKHFPNILVQDVSKYVDKIERILNNWKIYEIPYVKEIRDMISIHCADPSTDSFCDTLYQLLHNAKIEDVSKSSFTLI
jgi:lysosomal acid lipase/cholesteryl ester hydrolase